MSLNRPTLSPLEEQEDQDREEAFKEALLTRPLKNTLSFFSYHSKIEDCESDSEEEDFSPARKSRG